MLLTMFRHHPDVHISVYRIPVHPSTHSTSYSPYIEGTYDHPGWYMPCGNDLWDRYP